MAHKRIDSSLMAPETLRQVKEMAAQENRSELRRNNTLQDELNFEEPSPEK